MSSRIYTRTGDSGNTGLFGGQRVGKDDVRVEACGTVDELNSVLGLALVGSHDTDLARLITRLQNELFTLGADLATPESAGERHGGATITRVAYERVTAHEAVIGCRVLVFQVCTQYLLPG